jgi:ATP-grasp ribosomal peptide maturase
MSREQVILVLTHPFDPTADYVVTELNRRDAPVFRCDPGDFPKRLTLAATLETGWVGDLRRPERTVRLEDIGCVYYRRPSRFELADGMGDEVHRFASREAKMGVGGVLASLPRWLNHPGDIASAEFKPVQLAAARACGLVVPSTIITNDPRDAAAVLRRIGRAVYKPFTQGAVVENENTRVIFTTPVTPDDLDDSLALTAHLLQAWVDKQYELRLTVVDNNYFAVRIDAHSDAAAIDWRRDYANLSYSEIPDLPADVKVSVTDLMRRLRLRFAAIDFIVDPDGVHHFIDLNPNGQWAWIEDATGAPIASAIAEALLDEGGVS